MANVSVVKLKVRRGTDVERNLITLDEGEIGYTTDTKRLFVGDGSTVGGVAAGSKYVTAMAGITAGPLGVQTGDLVFDSTTSLFFVLTGNPATGALTYALSSYKAFTVTQYGAFSTSIPYVTGGPAPTIIIPSTTTSIILTATSTLTLPAPASYPGRWLFVKNAVSAVNIFSATANVIPLTGATGITLPNTTIIPQLSTPNIGKFAQLQSDGINWVVMAAN
jgi:hypothetical protein